MGAQYAIMRFAKYKGPEIGRIEAHNERTKEKYSNFAHRIIRTFLKITAKCDKK